MFFIFFPEDCVWGPWSTWSICSNSCGSGTNTRSRSKIKTEKNGRYCLGSGQDSKRCNTQPCAGKQATTLNDCPNFVFK